MEITYADEKNGGAFNENVILELTKLAQKRRFFGESRELNEEYSMPGTTWTMRAMFGQMPGLPLNISIDGNSMDTQSLFSRNYYAWRHITVRRIYANFITRFRCDFWWTKIIF